MTDMTSAAAAPARQEPLTSRVIAPVSSVATAPNHTGTKTHTSLSDMRTLRPSTDDQKRALSACHSSTDVICMPG